MRTVRSRACPPLLTCCCPSPRRGCRVTTALLDDPAGTATRAGTLRPPTRLATGRAALGALFVAVAALGVFAAWSAASAPPTSRYLVVAEDLPVGTTVVASDLGWAVAEVPDAVADRLFDDVDEVVGSVTVAPLSTGDPLTATAVVPAATAPEGAAEVALTLDRARAVAGDLDPGERVDVIATYGTGTEAWSEVLAPGATVVAVGDATDPGLGSSGQVVVTVAIGSDRVIAAVNALDAGALTLVRTTYAPSGEGPATFQPSPPQPRADSAAAVTGSGGEG